MTKNIVQIVIVLSLLPLDLHAREEPLIPPPLRAEDLGEQAAGVPHGNAAGEQETKQRPPAKARAPQVPRQLAIYLAGSFHDTDSDRAVDELVRDLLADRRGRLARLGRQLKRRPVLKLGRIQNRTGGHIHTAPMQRRATALLSASRALTIAKPGQGTDLLLVGYIVTLNDRSGDTELRSYQVRWSVFDVVTGEKIWLGISTRRKLVKGPKVGLPRVVIIPRGRAVDLSGNFNDHDALTLGKALATHLIASPFLKRRTVKRLQIRRLRNRTSEHVPTGFITVEVERALLGVRDVVLLAGPDELGELLRQNALPRPGAKRLAATHVMNGFITSTTNINKGMTHRRYQGCMEAIDLVTNLKHWMALKTVAKVFKSSGTSW